MTGLDRIRDYLLKKLSKVNINNPKANSGAVLIKLHSTWETEMDILVGVALHTMQIQFTRDTSSSPAGTANLTNLSFKIGQQMNRFLKRDPIPWYMEIRLGDLFIEAFYNCGYVDIYYPQTRDSSYIVSATAKYIELADIPELVARINIQATVTDRPKDISGMMQKLVRYETPLIKDKSAEDKLDLNAPYVKAINKLQQTGWRINRRVFDTVQNHKDLLLGDNPTSDAAFESEDGFWSAMAESYASKVVGWNWITHKAKALYDQDVFYQLMDVDYRGRLYYIEPFLNFQGPDISRGIMKFARSKPMTQEGLFWLAVHTANSFNKSWNIDEIPEYFEADYKSFLMSEKLDDISLDKLTLEDRVRWINHNMVEIIHQGQHCIINEEAEKPVSFLACCVEWYDYQLAVDNKRVHMSNLPIGIDGSNNGWQHLGAMSKDTKTGSLVGLVPTEIQKDFYVQTAKELINNTKDEARSELLSKIPMKKIRKGISKRGSMTRAYSAGATKIAENMWFDCRGIRLDTDYGMEEDQCIGFAKDLITAINIVCPGPLDTMDYLQKLAKFEIGEYKMFNAEGEDGLKEYNKLREKIKELYFIKDKTEEDIIEINNLVNKTKEFNRKLIYGNGSKTISWTTPSGFDVEYSNYRMETRKTVGTISGMDKYNKKCQVKHVAQVPTELPDVRGFMCGISPNFIHSMDASHMALVIDKWKGDFGAVHDSFSTHASDVEDLLDLTKSTFIEMYNQDNFYDYIEDQILTNKESLDIAQPKRGKLDINKIIESDYFFA